MSSEKQDEELIHEFSEASRKIKIPDNLRDSNRKFIKEALNSTSIEKRETLSWFRKGIIIPYPVAAVFLLIFFLQLALGFVNLTGYFTTFEQQTVVSTNSGNNSDKNIQPYYYENNVYVAGIGYVEKNINYTYFMENNNEGI